MPNNVGNGIQAPNSAWTFGGKTVDDFDQHIRSSVPFYNDGHQLICSLSDFFVKPDSVCYEIGSSLGALSAQLVNHHAAKPNTQWIGLDCEADMVQKASQIHRAPNLQFIHEDCCITDYKKSDLIVAYYTVQFIPPARRQVLLNRLFDALNWGGSLILFEKVRGPDARFQDILTTLYTDFKLNNNHSPEEIVNKTRSLKGILEPFSTQGNLDLLARAGFKDVMTVMKYLCFEGFLAIK